MNKTYLLIGTNEGNRLQHLNNAKFLIEQKVGKIISASSIYETAAWGKHDQPDFLNQVVRVDTLLTAQTCMQEILLIENAMGRIRTKKNDPRIIDIDILFFNNETINQTGLIVPHPELQNRRFVLIPMNELSPDLVHPGLHQSISYLLSTCKDDLPVRIFKE
jgi:2-amino-4-hydroxy-6-hydroxymethyldihydropteridine pyrophosphokinase